MENNTQKILLADDEAHIRTLMRTVINSLKLGSIIEAENGEEAVKLFKAESPVLTLLDINMPLKTGIEALKEIKEINPDSLVIMLTSLSDRDSVKQGVGFGASNYILKDNPIEEIKDMVKQTLEEYFKSEQASHEQ